MSYDKIIIGAGIYGLYAALYCGRLGQSVLVLEHDKTPFSRATYINQARVHMGYHYPRSYSTATKSAHYFNRFVDEYKDCIHDNFDQVYATSRNFSWTNSEQFVKFCKHSDIRCESIHPQKYFQNGLCDGAFLTTEYTYDAHILKDQLINEIATIRNIELRCGVQTDSVLIKNNQYVFNLNDGDCVSSGFVLNATYAAVNQILAMLGFDLFQIKYELCEIILCNVSDNLKGVGITVMDGPFFSIMPFGKTGYHSLTSVTFTPHATSYDGLPTFSCQSKSGGYCSPQRLGNCNSCSVNPKSAWPYMSSLARKYMKEKYQFEYAKSLFSIKPILKSSEIDDSRPTVIRQFSENPTFISVLSGKINTIYDMDGVLNSGYKQRK